MTRDLSAFYRLLQVASFSQGSPVNLNSIASEVGINSKVVENYFSILEDLLIGSYLYPFARRAKRRLIRKPKFYFFDCGIYNFARSTGYLDTADEIGYKFSYFRTATGMEVDFIAYGPKGFHAFEIKHTRNITNKHLRGLRSFAKDYPEAKLHIFYLGDLPLYLDSITAHPFETEIKNLGKILM